MAGAAGAAGAAHHSTRASVGHAAKDPYVDVSDQGGRVQAQALLTAGRVAQRTADRRGTVSPPTSVVTDISGSTGTVRWQGNLDGTLTGPSHASSKKIVFDYVRAHHTELGLVVADLKTLHLKRNYTDIVGTHHLFFIQKLKGKPMGKNGLTASVDKRGRLLTVGGIPHTTAQADKVPPASAWTITAGSALARTRGTVAPGGVTGDDRATKVLFQAPDGLRPAWETVVTSSETPATTVIDAVTGKVLQRTPLTQYENSTGRVYKFFPGAGRGGHHVRVNFTARHWLGKHARILSGNNSHTYSDVNDNNRPSRTEEVHPQRGHSWGYRLVPFHLKFAKKFCGKPWPCSWNPNKGFSWRKNRAQNATQVFYFVNNWHDHLKAAPIGFNEAAGNFQLKNHSRHGKAGDPVATQTDDGANTQRGPGGRRIGLPDGGHVDNANMSTPPDGQRPRMQMYLQHYPHTPYGLNGDPWSPTNVGDEADTVYHEYTHGLSNRLNVDVRGRTTLGGVQAGAMGEAWSDWYALDYLVKKGLQRDRKNKADIRIFKYDGIGVNYDRTEPIDCKVDQNAASLCQGGTTKHRGGYTYADYGNVAGGPEVHADGEIWSQTLWDLRDRLGSKKTESLVTRAMELASYNPSFIDMRNAILVADTAVDNGAHHHAIWQVFAHRGMGFYAGSLGGNDTEPAASFDLPPATATTGTITGNVKDQDSGDNLEGETVSLKFAGAGFTNPTAVTDASGDYTLENVPVGHYLKLQVEGHGYSASTDVTVTSGSTVTKDFTPRKDWAAPGTGATVTTKAYQYPGCGVDAAIDGSQASGWSSNAGPGTSTDASQGFVPKHMVVDLHRTLDVTGFGVDPSNTCGDDFSTAVQDYTIETSPDRATWTPFDTSGHPAFDGDDIGQLVQLNGTAPGVRYVKFTIKSNQTADDPAGYLATCGQGGGPFGCSFTDLTELAVYGTTTP